MLSRLPKHDANFSFELTGDRGAALVTRHQTISEDTSLETAFETYTKRHYKSWVEFARHKQYGNDIRPFLVSGFDMTKDFAMVAYSNRGHLFESNDTIAIPMFTCTSSPFQGTWRTKHQVYVTDGPHQRSSSPREQVPDPSSSPSGDAGSIINEFNQCVFLRYYTMRWRKWMPMLPKVVRAGAGPHDLGSGDNRGDTFPELAVQYDPEHTKSYDAYLGRRSVPTAGDTGSEGDYDYWDPIADYVFEVILFFVSPSDYSTLSTEELQRYICINAPSRPDEDSCGRSSTDIELQNLISGQAGSSDDISSLLATKRPNIVVEENGGQLTP